MEQVSRKLTQLRRTARAMLLAQRISQWLAVVVAVVLALVLVDYLLRLPGWGRLILGAVLAVLAIGWLIGQIVEALGFRPALSSVALRAERIFPQLSGLLATGIEFALPRNDAIQSPRMAQFISASLRQAEERLQGVALSRLLEPKRTLRMATAAAVAIAVLVSLAAAFPAQAAIATQRWLNPLGDAQWPRWTQVVSDVHAVVWPTDEPLPMRAIVSKGYRPNMRVGVNYRLVQGSQVGRWHHALMNDQGIVDANTADGAARQGRFERMIDLPALVETTQLASAEGAIVEFYFEAGDDATSPQQVQLVARPAVMSAILHIEPPAYAQGLLETQRIALEQQSGQRASAAAFIGSTVRFEVQLNKPIPLRNVSVSALASGLPADATFSFSEDETATLGDHLSFSFRLNSTIETPLTLVDEHGLSSASERIYRIEAIEDKPPAVTIAAPATDESVLPTALIDLNAMAHDDVGVARVSLHVDLPAQPPAAPPADGAQGANEKPRTRRDLAVQEGREPRLTVTDQLDLATLTLKSGDVVELHAGAQDVFDLDGQHHDIVQATPRLLRIIDEATFESQLRGELAGVRQQVVRVQQQQADLLQAEGDQALAGQQQVQRRLNDQSMQMQRLRQRMQRNRFQEQGLEQLLNDAQGLLAEAQQESRDAINHMQQAAREAEAQRQAQAEQQQAQARQRQANVEQKLQDLVNLLDQGRDAQALQARLRDLLRQQQNLAGDTRQMLPRTLGRTVDQLNEEERAALNEQAQRERELAEQAAQLIRQMHATAEAIARQGENIDSQATAAAMREAAAIAQRQGLQQRMQQAAENAQQNRLSQANNEQNEAIDVMEQMLSEMNNREQRRQEMLRRQLARLADAIQKLIQQQKVQLDRLEKAAELVTLEEPLAALRRNTLSVEQSAREVRETVEVADLLAQAAEAQGQGILRLRDQNRNEAKQAEELALAKLEEALRKTQQMQDQQAQEEMRRQREELRKAYEQLAARERALRQQTAELAALENLNRRQRAQLNELAAEQKQIREEAAALKEKVAETLLFQHLHERVDDRSGVVADALGQAKLSDRVVIDQDYIAAAFETMAKALEDAQQEEDFAGQQGDGGGGGGGGGGQQPLIPPVAELKALRGMQEHVYLRTRAVAGDGDRPVTPETLMELAAEQRELPALAERLIQQLQQQQQPQLPPVDGQ